MTRPSVVRPGHTPGPRGTDRARLMLIPSRRQSRVSVQLAPATRQLHWSSPMLRRSLATIALVFGIFSAPAMFPTTTAHAATVEISVGSILNGGRGISCGQGERMLRLRGYRDIRRVDCAGRF